MAKRDVSPYISSPTSVGLGMEGLILVIEPSTLTGQGNSCLALSAKFRLGDSPASCRAGGVPACLGLPDGSDWNEAVKLALAVGRDSCKSKERCALCSERLHWLTTMECSGLVLPFVLAVKSPWLTTMGQLYTLNQEGSRGLCPTCDGGLVNLLVNDLWLVLNVFASVLHDGGFVNLATSPFATHLRTRCYMCAPGLFDDFEY